jgi:hypothetical protein
MTILTVCQPYADLIARGQKLVENREWYTAYRGWLGIHAGKSRKHINDYPCNEESLDYGAVVAVARLDRCLHFDRTGGKDCVLQNGQHMRDHEHTHGTYCFVLRDILRLRQPYPIAGQRGLWEASVKVLRFSCAGVEVTSDKSRWDASDVFEMVPKVRGPRDAVGR